MPVIQHVVVVLSCLAPLSQEAEAPRGAVPAPEAPAPGEALATRSLAEGATRKATRLADLAWLAGSWRGEGMGGAVEEIWSTPRAGTMMGMFRFMPGGEVAFYELMTLAPDEDGWLELRVKHFRADMTAWEDKEVMVRFPLLEVEGTTAWFDGLTLSRDGGSLRALLRMRSTDGTRMEVPFAMERVED